MEISIKFTVRNIFGFPAVLFKLLKICPDLAWSNLIHLFLARWEMATARNALKFKKQVENGDFIPPEIKKKLEEKQAITGGLTKVGRGKINF